ATQSDLTAISLRQGTTSTGAPGVFGIDNLYVGTSFAQVVVPEPTEYAAMAAGGLLAFALVRRQVRK
ncbi:MAG TPA: PEP-CTERM sorting domain-containing protein, partial [Candidatus Limnocylindria bacterium]|nr:PEP-CTERM sorting domain-containing protein [Candidatus Limnocylindria bacterium]